MLKLIACLLIFGVCPGHCFWFYNPGSYDGLKVKFGINPLTSFINQPRTTDDAIKAGYVKLDGCNLNAPWRGQRYAKDNDLGLVLLFDSNGFIAGIQSVLPENNPNNYPGAALHPPFVHYNNSHVISVYFVNPATICTTGRSASDFQAQGTGTGLYIQNSAVPEESFQVPRDESDLAGTQWTEGRCFIGMGKHYWWDLFPDMECGEIFPFFLLYNDNILNGFGFAFTSELQSPIYEHPPQASYSSFMVTVPNCLATAGVMSTLHVYMDDSLLEYTC